MFLVVACARRILVACAGDVFSVVDFFSVLAVFSVVASFSLTTGAGSFVEVGAKRS